MNRFANDVYGYEFKNPVYYVKCGSGNDFYRDNEKYAVNGKIDLRPFLKNLPLITVKGIQRRFVNGIGYGIDGETCRIGDIQRATSDKPVNYSKIDPKLCHVLFIRSALVEADCDFRYPFFRQNQELVEEIESEEDKARRRDIMVDDELLFQFYSERIPEDVISAVTFDTWWKEKSRTEPDLLNYEKNFLISDSSKLVDKDDYPDRMKIGRFYLKLTYEFNPSEDDDGVTVHVPLPVLNQLHEHDFDFIHCPWIQEGLLHCGNQVAAEAPPEKLHSGAGLRRPAYRGGPVGNQDPVERHNSGAHQMLGASAKERGL